MPKQSQRLRERYIAYYIAQGFEQVACRSEKYICMRSQDMSVFLGKAGAVRISRDGTVVHSVDIADQTKKALLKWEERRISNGSLHNG